MTRYFNISNIAVMKLHPTWIVFLLFMIAFQSLRAQLPPVQYPAPRLYYVTVSPETGFDSLIWYSISNAYPEIDYYRVAVATISDPYADPPDIVYVPIGTVNVPDTVFVNTDLESSFHSVGYTVWGINDLGGGNLQYGSFEQPPDSTMFLEAVFDSCQATITLSWNDYNKWRGYIDEYNIFRRTAPFVYNLIATVSGTTNTFVINNVAANQQYALFVEAVNHDRIRRSTSNRALVITDMSQQPNNINADFATISPDNSIALSFTIAGASAPLQYNLVRGDSPSGPFTQVTSFVTGNAQISYTDNIPFTSGVHYYRLEGINNCGQASALSNMASNIILKGTLSGNNVSLSWNEYYEWLGGVEQYRVIRTNGQNNPVTDTLDFGPDTQVFLDDISGLANYENPISSLVCFQVEATERPNMYGTQGKSFSNRLCFSIHPDIRMPNAFIPNDADQTNQVFEPVFSFLPEHYEMTIYNRLGNKIWEGSSPWDGRVNGKFVPEGVYLYYIRIYNYSTDFIELNGKVTVVYR